MRQWVIDLNSQPIDWAVVLRDTVKRYSKNSSEYRARSTGDHFSRIWDVADTILLWSAELGNVFNLF